MYLKRFGRQISKEETYDKAIKLIQLVEIVYQPLTKEDLLKVEESRREIKEKIVEGRNRKMGN